MSDNLKAAAERVEKWLDGGCNSYGLPAQDIRKLVDATKPPEKTESEKLADALVVFGDLGGVIDQLGGNCPVQAEGKIDGQRFYFRARGTSWQWHVAETEAEIFDNPQLYIERTYSDDQYAAGWMPQHEAVGFMCEGARLWKLQVELFDAYEGEGNSDRVTFLQWMRDMAANDKGTMQEAAKRYLDGIHDVQLEPGEL